MQQARPRCRSRTGARLSIRARRTARPPATRLRRRGREAPRPLASSEASRGSCTELLYKTKRLDNPPSRPWSKLTSVPADPSAGICVDSNPTYGRNLIPFRRQALVKSALQTTMLVLAAAAGAMLLAGPGRREGSVLEDAHRRLVRRSDRQRLSRGVLPRGARAHAGGRRAVLEPRRRHQPGPPGRDCLSGPERRRLQRLERPEHERRIDIGRHGNGGARERHVLRRADFGTVRRARRRP